MQIEKIKENIKELQKKNYIPLSGDLQFKFIFGTSENIKYTTRLLELLLKKEKGLLEKSKIYNEIKLTRETIVSKSFELDVVIELPDESLTNIEMQRELRRNAEIKNTLFVLRLFGNIVKKGKKYNTAKKVSQLEFIKKNYQHKTRKMINTYHLTNDDDSRDKILEDLFEIITVDIEKTNNKVYNEDVDEELERFIKVINAETLESALEEAGDNLLLLEVLKSLTIFNNNDYVQDYARDQALIESEKETAVEEAEKKGRKEEKLEIAKNLLKNTSMTIEEISLNIGLTKNEIETLKKNLEE